MLESDILWEKWNGPLGKKTQKDKKNKHNKIVKVDESIKVKEIIKQKIAFKCASCTASEKIAK